MQYVYPAGVQRGATVEATVSGTNLQDTSGIRFAPADITGRVVKVVNPTTVTISLTASATALGEHDIRLLNPRGASNRYRFQVGQLPEISEKPPNNDREHAQQLPALPILVNGQILEGQRDYYRFPLAAGKMLVCRAQAREILPFIPNAVPGWLDACLTLFDSAGKELASVDDSRLDPDPVLIYKTQAPGDYILEVRDILDRGRGDFVYRLSVGFLPQITSISPLGGQCGKTTRVALNGANLPAQSLDVAIPADSPSTRNVELVADGITSNSVPLSAANLPESEEKEPNDTPESANPVQTPGVVNARIGRPGDADWYRFAAKGGQTLALEIRAHRLDSLLDSILAIFDTQGHKLAENDDWVDPDLPLLTRHSDSRLVYTFPANGDYLVRVLDVQGKGGEDYAYRLLIGPPRPDFSLRGSPDAPLVARGDSVILTVTANRKDGFDGEIEVTPANLPPGFQASHAYIVPGQTTAPMTITAAPDAPLAAIAAPTLNGTAKVAGAQISRPVNPSETVMQAFSYTQYPTAREMIATVAEGGTLSLAPASKEVVDVPQGGKAKVTLKATRSASGAIPLWLASGVQNLNVNLREIGAFENEITFTIGAPKTAQVGFRQNVIIAGSLKVGNNTVYRTAPAISVRVVAPR